MSPIPFNWANAVICPKCQRSFDFAHDPANVHFPRKNYKLVIAKCPYCKTTSNYTPSKWSDTYRNIDRVFKEQNKHLGRLAKAVKELHAENESLKRSLARNQDKPDNKVGVE